jgi:predicted nucleic acid-binding Zn ribbon protein
MSPPDPPANPHGQRGGWPVRIGDILAPALERMGPKSVWTEAKLRKLWRDVVGEQVATHCTVRRLRGKVLEVDVASDSWATELTYLAPAVVEKLNAQLGDEIVTQVAVRRRKSQRF